MQNEAYAASCLMGILKKVIDEGGVPMGGEMPAFNGKLKDDEKLAVIPCSRVSGRTKYAMHGYREAGSSKVNPALFPLGSRTGNIFLVT